MYWLIIVSISLLEIQFSSQESPRNVLILLGDDVGLDLNVYNNSVIKMPNVDGLAKRGVTFKNGFTAVSSCSPSRYDMYLNFVSFTHHTELYCHTFVSPTFY